MLIIWSSLVSTRDQSLGQKRINIDSLGAQKKIPDFSHESNETHRPSKYTVSPCIVYTAPDMTNYRVLVDQEIPLIHFQHGHEALGKITVPKIIEYKLLDPGIG